jgi:hypothetical protein
MSKYGIKDITILYYRHNLISLMTSCITMPSYKYYVSDIIKSQLFLFLIAVCSVKTLAIVYNYVPQTKFGRHIVFAPFLIIILLLLLSFFRQKFIRHISRRLLNGNQWNFTGMLSTMSRCAVYFRNFQNGHRCHGNGQNAKKIGKHKNDHSRLLAKQKLMKLDRNNIHI